MILLENSDFVNVFFALFWNVQHLLAGLSDSHIVLRSLSRKNHSVLHSEPVMNTNKNISLFSIVGT